jgi:exosortase E/protease (VPEID-CTERM system)
MGLMLGFCGAWLFLCRREYRFPRALLLLPIGLAVSFGLNVLRIAGLMVIGDRGYPDVALYGFHSVAGWIAFNAAAVGLAYVSRRSTWLRREALHTEPSEGANPTAAYLLPLLAMLGVGLVTRAVSSGFETLYALRIVAGAALLWHFRAPLRRLDWRCGGWAVAAGVAVAAVWFGAAHFLTASSPMPSPLRSMAEPARILWIAARVVGSVIVVPIAEELAYRGFLMRRLAAVEFESLPFRSVGTSAVVISAIAFGAVHGALWLPGIVAGAVYGMLPVRSGRFGDAVIAHAMTNALVTVGVLAAGEWQLW